MSFANHSGQKTNNKNSCFRAKKTDPNRQWVHSRSGSVQCTTLLSWLAHFGKQRENGLTTSRQFMIKSFVVKWTERDSGVSLSFIRVYKHHDSCICFNPRLGSWNSCNKSSVLKCDSLSPSSGVFWCFFDDESQHRLVFLIWMNDVVLTLKWTTSRDN